jgi:anti-sigma factor RsiW
MDNPAPVTEAEIQAYADGVLPEGRRAAVEAWLATRPEEAESIAAYRRVRDGLRELYDPVLGEPLPSTFRLPKARRARWGRYAAAAACFIAVFALGTFTGLLLHSRYPIADLRDALPSQMVHRAAVAHVVYAPEVRHPVEVTAAEQAHLVGWLSKRLGTKVSAPKLEPEGLTLVGGRLLPGEKAPAASLMYETRDGRRVTLYWSPETRHRGETQLRYARQGRVDVFYWIDEECGYALASADFSKDELRRVALLAHEQLEK